MAKQSPLISLFKEQLENDSNSLKSKYELGKRGDLLTWWYFLFIEELDEAEILEIICDGGNDLGIDAIWIDDDEIVHFYQFKNPTKLNSAFPDGDVDKVLSGLRLILNQQLDKIANDDLKGLVSDVFQKVRSGYRLHLVSSGAGIGKESKVKLNGFADDLQMPTEEFFQWQDINISFLQDRFYKKNLPTVDSPIVWEVDHQPYPVRSAEHDTYLLDLPGQLLADLYQEHGEQLLQQNIRVYSGDRVTNKSIRYSCTSDESGNFLHYNNGVTFLAEDAAWDAFAKTLQINQSQVVNGGQTVRVLFAAMQDGQLRDDVRVVVRVITSHGDKGFANKVAVNLNNQNRMATGFLKSTDPRVVQLANNLTSMGWYLERRANEVKGLSEDERKEIENRIGNTLEDRVLKLKESTQAYVATFMRLPELAKKNPKLMFESASEGGYFDRIFNQDLTAEKFIQANSISSATSNFVKEFNRRKRRKDKEASWEDDYAQLLGSGLVMKHGSKLDQVIPQSGVFLNAALYEDFVILQERPIEELLAELQKHDYGLFIRIIGSAIDFVDSDSRLSGRSWPTLLKSQTFFDGYFAFRRGETSGARESNSQPSLWPI